MKNIDRILKNVEKPARYTGGEYNQIIKNKDDIDIRLAFCFPDTYEIGMSNLGMKILYNTMNSLDFVWCERVFAPWIDMYHAMKDNTIPLYALESGDPLSEFDAIAFSIGYEMAYTTVLDMINQAGLPLRSKDRNNLLPIVFAGGSACVNPAPLSPFVDLFVIGEGEEMNNELLTLLRDAKINNWSKFEFLKKASQIQGVYVPSLYTFQYNNDGTVKNIEPLYDAPKKVKKRIIKDLDSAPYPTNPIVPSTEVVHDRINLELFRGCIRGCRFCQAGYIYRPVRSKRKETLAQQAIQALKNTGYEDITLLSLSSSDYRNIGELCDSLLDFCEPNSIGISLPSLRADNFSFELMHKLQKVRKSGLTFAVEGGSQRLRDVINKNVTQEDLLNTCKIAFEGGWNSVKLYYMLGLPTETDEDIIGISQMANEVLHVWRQYAKYKNRGMKITISTSCFIPKPHSPFQWEPQITIEEYIRRVNLLRASLQARNVVYNWHDAETSLIEAVLSRGDERIADVIEKVYLNGGRLESWSDFFSFDRWIDAFKSYNIDPSFYANRARETDEILPWDIIDVGVNKAHLIREFNLAHQGKLSPDCRKSCLGCGANSLLEEGRNCDE